MRLKGIEIDYERIGRSCVLSSEEIFFPLELLIIRPPALLVHQDSIRDIVSYRPGARGGPFGGRGGGEPVGMVD